MIEALILSTLAAIVLLAFFFLAAALFCTLASIARIIKVWLKYE